MRNELSNYQCIPRELIFDSSLSDRARFVFCYMVSKPNDWKFFLKPMAEEIGYSVETLRKYLKELVDSGWIVKGEQENTNGTFGAVEYTLRASKKTEQKEEEIVEETEDEIFRYGKNPTQHKRDNKQKRDNINNNNHAEPCKTSVTRHDYDNDFERAFALYGRKGSKASAYKWWQRLSDVEKELVFSHIPHYLSAHEVQYRKDFSGYLHQKYFNNVVYKNNVIIYDPNSEDSNIVESTNVEGKKGTIVINGQTYR